MALESLRSRFRPTAVVVILTLGILVLAGVWRVRRLSADSTLAEHRQRIEQMHMDQRDQLLRQRKRFAELRPAEQDRLRRLSRQIEHEPDAESLRGVMLRYHDWLTTLESGQRAELASLPTDRKLQQILRRRQRELREQAQHLSEEDLQGLARWLEGVVMSRFPPWQRTLAARRLAEKTFSERTADVLLAVRRSAKRAPLIDEKNAARLAAQLSEPNRKKLETAADLDTKRRLVFSWIRQLSHHVQQKLRTRLDDIDEQKLADFFDHLSSEERNRLMGLPPEEIQRELRLMYLNDHNGPRFGEPRRDRAPRKNLPQRPGAGLSPLRDLPRGDARRRTPHNGAATRRRTDHEPP